MPLLRPGDCVKVPDGRSGRVREKEGAKWRVRVRRRGGTTDELLLFSSRDLRRIDPPKGWMSPEGYNRRLAAARHAGKERRRNRGAATSA